MSGYGNSVVGKIRKINEDSFLIENGHIGPLPNLYAVADGMGGHLAGEVASKMAVDCLRQFLEEYKQKPLNIVDALVSAVSYANEKIYANASENIEHIGMGTTLLAVTVKEKVAYIVNVGDSRLYVVNKRENAIKQITADHSYVMELVRKGEITPEEAENHPNRNIITRALGTGQNVRADSFVYELWDKDRLLLCTDGLNNMLSDREIIEICNRFDDNSQIVDCLLNEANEKGGIDNISVILYSVGEGDK